MSFLHCIAHMKLLEVTCDIIYGFLIVYHFCIFFHILGIGIFANFQISLPLKFLGILTILESQQEVVLLIDYKRSIFTVFVQRMSKILFQHKSLSILPFVRPCVRRLAPIPSGESQDVTNKSCSICLRGDPWGPWRSRT